MRGEGNCAPIADDADVLDFALGCHFDVSYVCSFSFSTGSYAICDT